MEKPGLFESVKRLDKDIANASIELSLTEVRFLVDAYYAMQDDRIKYDAQVRELTKAEEPHDVVYWLGDQSRVLENQIKRALDKFSAGDVLGQWARSIVGIGPVIAAGLLAHIDLERAPTAGHIWRFAGLDPTVEWAPKTKRPWNADLKTLCWKIGESFVKTKGNENGFYGHLYDQRKALEIERNNNGEFKQQAEKILADKKFKKDTIAYKAYSQGVLPAGHLHARARRYAVKIFLSHYHMMGYRLVLGKEPPVPYPIAILNHAHMIDPPS